MSVLRTDVVVVGAGPAGSASAISLARAGRDVVLVDKATFPRDKCCGDGLTASALRLAQDLGVQPHTMPSWQAVHDVVLHGPDQRWAHLTLPGHGAYSAVVRRRELDAALVTLARQAGSQVRLGAACTSARTGTDRVTVELEGGDRIDARYAIGADGMWSTLRKAVGAPHPRGYRGEWHAFRQYLRPLDSPGPQALGTPPSPATDRSAQHVWFEADLLPGYAWCFPLGDGAVNVGFGITRAAGPAVGDMGRLWADVLGRRSVSAVVGHDPQPEGPHRAWPIPARVHDVTLTSPCGRVLFVGDAAAATDPLTGEGIGQALLTGQLAARTVLRAGPSGAGWAAAHYPQAVAEELAADHRLARYLSRALRRPRQTSAALSLIGASGWTRRNFARWMFEDYPRALLFTPSRWARGALEPVPAFL